MGKAKIIDGQKYCPGCKNMKPFSDFGKEKRAQCGMKPRCKVCYNNYYNSKYSSFKEKKIITIKKRYNNKKHELRRKAKEYNARPEVKSKKKVYNQAYQKNNRAKISKKSLEYHHSRYKFDENYRMNRRVRKLLTRLAYEKNEKTFDLLGYTLHDFTRKVGVPQNGEAIDHKIPVSWFLVDAPPRVVNHLDNLQIVSATENIKKLNRYSDIVTIDFYKIAIPFIKPKYLTKIKYGSRKKSYSLAPFDQPAIHRSLFASTG